jgi:hypothetical protein
MTSQSNELQSPVVKACADVRRYWKNGERITSVILWALLSVYLLVVMELMTRGKSFGADMTAPVWFFFLLPMVSLLSGLLLWRLVRNHYSPHRTDATFSSILCRRERIAGLTAEICYSLIFAFGTVALLYYLIASWAHASLVRFAGGGVIFTVVSAIMGFVGTLLALQQILELKHSIVTFTQLQERLINLLAEAKSRNDTILIVAYTILPGAFNVAKELKDALDLSVKACKGRVKVVTLHESVHEEWLSLFKGKTNSANRKVITSEYIREFAKQCNRTLQDLRDCDADDGECVFYRNWDEMPGYYFFLSSHRAILIAPLNMPRIGVVNGTGDKGILAVDPVGFETTDRKMVDMLRSEFARYAHTTDLAASKQERTGA